MQPHDDALPAAMLHIQLYHEKNYLASIPAAREFIGQLKHGSLQKLLV